MMLMGLRLLLVLLALLAAKCVFAAGLDTDPETTNVVALRGFGTIGMARLSNDRYGAISSFSQRHPVYDDWSPNLDSVLGLQADVLVSERNSMVFQGTLRPGESDIPVLQLGYWEVRPTASTKARIGRIPTPMFRETEYFHVGYAQLAVRPALPVYSKLSAISHIDGGDLRWQIENGDWVYGLQFFGGNGGYTHQTYLGGYEPLRARIRDMRGLVVKAISGSFTFRASHTLVGRSSYESREVKAVNEAIDAAKMGLKLAGQTAQASQIAMYRNPLDSTNLRYSSIGIDWQPGEWQFIGEVTLLDPKSHVIGVSKAWQVTAARSFENFTPYFFYSRQLTRKPDLVEDAFAGPGLAPLRDEIATVIRRGDLSMSSMGLGVRFEVKSDLALKLQVEKLRWNVPYVGAENSHPGRDPRATLFSVVMDFVF